MIVKNPTKDQIKEKIVRVYCAFHESPYNSKLLNKTENLKLPAYLMMPIQDWANGKIALIVNY